MIAGWDAGPVATLPGPTVASPAVACRCVRCRMPAVMCFAPGFRAGDPRGARVLCERCGYDMPGGTSTSLLLEEDPPAPSSRWQDEDVGAAVRDLFDEAQPHEFGGARAFLRELRLGYHMGGLSRGARKIIAPPRFPGLTGAAVLVARGEGEWVRQNMIRARAAVRNPYVMTRSAAVLIGKLGHEARRLYGWCSPIRPLGQRRAKVAKEMRRYAARAAAGLCVRCAVAVVGFRECAGCRTRKQQRRSERRLAAHGGMK